MNLSLIHIFCKLTNQGFIVSALKMINMVLAFQLINTVYGDNSDIACEN